MEPPDPARPGFVVPARTPRDVEHLPEREGRAGSVEGLVEPGAWADSPLARSRTPFWGDNQAKLSWSDAQFLDFTRTIDPAFKQYDEDGEPAIEGRVLSEKARADVAGWLRSRLAFRDRRLCRVRTITSVKVDRVKIVNAGTSRATWPVVLSPFFSPMLTAISLFSCTRHRKARAEDA